MDSRIVVRRDDRALPAAAAATQGAKAAWRQLQDIDQR